MCSDRHRLIRAGAPRDQRFDIAACNRDLFIKDGLGVAHPVFTFERELTAMGVALSTRLRDFICCDQRRPRA